MEIKNLPRMNSRLQTLLRNHLKVAALTKTRLLGRGKQLLYPVMLDIGLNVAELTDNFPTNSRRPLTVKNAPNW